MPGIVPSNSTDGSWTSPSPTTSLKDLQPALEGPLVWTGADFDDRINQPIIDLTGQDITEIEAQLGHFKDSGLDSRAISKETFRLSRSLADKLVRVSEIVHNGVGFAIVRGLNSKKYSHQDNVLIFAGLSSYVAAERRDLSHIYNRESYVDGSGQILRPPNRAISMDFHTDVDSGDILAFYTQGKAKSGGLQRIASLSTVYNELMDRSPQVIDTLLRPWRFEIPWSNGTEVINRPLLYNVENRVFLTFATAFIKGSDYDTRLPDSPPFTQEQETARQAIIDKCWKHALDINTELGDLFFLNNFALLHQRDAFVDDISTGQVRHLIGLMLRDPERAWPQPPELKVFIDARFKSAGARCLPMVDQWDASRSEAGGQPRGYQNRTTGSGERGSSSEPLRRASQSSTVSGGSYSSSSSNAQPLSPTASRDQRYAQTYQPAQDRVPQYPAAQSGQPVQRPQYGSNQRLYQQAPPNNMGYYQQRAPASSRSGSEAEAPRNDQQRSNTTGSQGQGQGSSRSASQDSPWLPQGSGSRSMNEPSSYKHD